MGLFPGVNTLIGRKSTLTLAEAYRKVFVNRVYKERAQLYSTRRTGDYVWEFQKHELYDFLYASEYEPWFLQLAEKSSFGEKAFKDFLMHLHTGDSIAQVTRNWTPEQRTQLGQQLLKKLAEDILVRYESLANSVRGGWWSDETKTVFSTLVSQLELDGYVFRNGTLQLSEAMVVNAEQESGVLQGLVNQLKLDKAPVIKHHLDLSETHYVEGKWDDCIANSRKYLECVLQESATRHCLVKTGQPLAETIHSTPIEVRKYLEKEGLFDHKEIMALAGVYGLLSNTGNHPYIAAKDQARLTRNLALTFAQFALLRLQGALGK